MSWRETLTPVRMERIGLVAPLESVHSMLTAVAANGQVELDLPYEPRPDPAEFDRAEHTAVASGPVAGLVGWTPSAQLDPLARALAPLGAAVVPLVRPRGVEPPTLLTGERRTLGVGRILVDTYGTVPYRDLDPSKLAVASYVVMFGIMFGDVGHGAVLALAGVAVLAGWIPRLRRYRNLGGFVIAAGLTSMLAGLLYGEAFGPTGLVPTLWISPLDDPITLMVAGLVVGAVLLAIAFIVGAIDRVREGGWRYALYARTGIAGVLLYAAVGLLACALVFGIGALYLVAAVAGALALTILFVGMYVEAGGGGLGLVQASVELFDSVIRLGSNLVSFARLAAFGLTHAALTTVVWEGTTALWAADWRAPLAILLFVAGNALAFALELLVAGVQALRLEYYELFSRIFQAEGRPFRPWAPSSPDEHDDSSTTLQKEGAFS